MHGLAPQNSESESLPPLLHHIMLQLCVIHRANTVYYAHSTHPQLTHPYVRTHTFCTQPLLRPSRNIVPQTPCFQTKHIFFPLQRNKLPSLIGSLRNAHPPQAKKMTPFSAHCTHAQQIRSAGNMSIKKMQAKAKMALTCFKCRMTLIIMLVKFVFCSRKRSPSRRKKESDNGGHCNCRMQSDTEKCGYARSLSFPVKPYFFTKKDYKEERRGEKKRMRAKERVYVCSIESRQTKRVV